MYAYRFRLLERQRIGMGMAPRSGGPLGGGRHALVRGRADSGRLGTSPLVRINVGARRGRLLASDSERCARTSTSARRFLALLREVACRVAGRPSADESSSELESAILACAAARALSEGFLMRLPRPEFDTSSCEKVRPSKCAARRMKCGTFPCPERRICSFNYELTWRGVAPYLTAPKAHCSGPAPFAAQRPRRRDAVLSVCALGAQMAATNGDG